MDRQTFTAYLEKQRSACDSRARFLHGNERRDEADFELIRKNVYDIFLTVFNTAFRTQKSESLALSFFEEKLRTIPENWRTSLERAERHGDVQKQHIENLKLEVLGEIAACFEQMRRESHD